MIKKIALILIFTTSLYANITSFNSGEVTPLLQGRTDLKKYYSGCRTLENLIVLPHGPVRKRPGTHYIASTKTASLPARLIPFEFSTEQAYTIEMGNLYMRFYANGGQVIDANSNPVEVVTPYLTADLFDIQFIQSADVMYLAHNNYPTATLTRTTATSFTYAEVDFESGPFMPENTTTTTITPSATTGSITLTASSSIFTSDHVGSSWQVSHVVEANNIAGDFNSVSTSSTLTIQKNRRYHWITSGVWVGTVILQRSFDSGSTWNDVKPHVSKAGVPNISLSDIEGVDNAIYRINMTDYTSGTCSYDLVALSHKVNGIVDISAYTSGTVVTGTVVETLGGTTAVTTWSEGSFSEENGYPGALAFYDERLALAGTNEEQQTTWLSKTNDWPDFETGELATDSLRYDIASDQVNKIVWLSSQRALLIGTTGSEWKLSASNPDEPLAFDNFTAKRQSSYGSDVQQSLAVNNNVFFVQRQAKKIRKLIYEFANDNYVAPDITILAEHLTSKGIKQMALQKAPYTILWAVTDDGDLLSLTFEEFEEVIGWSIHTYDGDVESVAVIPGTGEDEVWLQIERTVDGSTVRYVEQADPFDWGDQDEAFFLDSGLSYDGGSAVTVTKITHADPAVVTAASHGFSDGEQIRLSNVMTELNDKVFTVGTITTSTFELRDKLDAVDINTIGFSNFTSGGTAIAVENSFTNLGHLEGETVVSVGDGGYAGEYTVSSSATTLDDYYNVVHIGLPYTLKLKPMRLELPETSGQLQGLYKRIIAVTLRFYETLGCDLGPSFTKFETLAFRDAQDVLDTATPLFTGDKRVLFQGSWETDGDICVQQSLPLPFTLLSMPRIEFEANR